MVDSSETEIRNTPSSTDEELCRNGLRMLEHLNTRHQEELANNQKIRTRTQVVLLSNSTVFGFVVSNIDSLHFGAGIFLFFSLAAFVIQFGIALWIWMPYSTIVPGAINDDELWFGYVDKAESISIAHQLQDLTGAIEAERDASKKLFNAFVAYCILSISGVLFVVLAFFCSIAGTEIEPAPQKIEIQVVMPPEHKNSKSNE